MHEPEKGKRYLTAVTVWGSESNHSSFPSHVCESPTRSFHWHWRHRDERHRGDSADSWLRCFRLRPTPIQHHRPPGGPGSDRFSGVVVTSSAVNEQNPEVVEARQRKIPVIQRAEMLAELMRLKYGIAVAGMHGKTTTTSMIATVLAAGGLDPTVVVGGRVDALGSNARLGKSQYLVAEADESDRSFLKLSPILSVVTNLDREHMDCYRDMEDVEAAFLEFMERVPFYGACTACIDNPQLAALLPRVQRRVFTYGTSSVADYVLRMLPPAEGTRSRFEVAAGGLVLGPFSLNVPGRHNVLNATAAVAIGTQLEVSCEDITHALRDFRGVDRRFQLKGTVHGVSVVDDYGHHPTEIRATLSAARESGYRHVHVIFQPHRYTRTQDLMAEFATAFDQADTVQVLDIYAASEEPIAGVDAPNLVRTIGRKEVQYAPSFDEAISRTVAHATDGDIILTLGAGSVSQASPLVLEALARS
jgi:UDP-N-acetylmuramate--alanine ligase